MTRLRHRRHRVHRRARGATCGRVARTGTGDLPRRGAARAPGTTRGRAGQGGRARPRRRCGGPSAAARSCSTPPGYVGSRPAERVWQVNALAPRIAVEAAAAEDVRRVVVTSSVAGIGPAPPDRPGTEDDPYRGGGSGSPTRTPSTRASRRRWPRARGWGWRWWSSTRPTSSARRSTAPTRARPPTALIGNYLRGPAPRGGGRARRTSWTCATWPRATCSPPSAGAPGERYVLGGHDLRWVELIERVARAVGRAPPARGAAARGRRAGAPRGGAAACPRRSAAEGVAADGRRTGATPRPRRAASSATARARSTARCATRSPGTAS